MFKFIYYALLAKRAKENPEELLADFSFGPIEGFFIISFVILGIISLGLGFLAFSYGSKITLFFAILFLAILSIDIYIFLKVKRFFLNLTQQAVSFSQKKYQKIIKRKIGDREEVIDAEVQEISD